MRQFYRKRLARIVPSYYFCTLIYLFLIILPEKNFSSFAAFWADRELRKQLVANLTFTQVWTRETYILSPFNGALWTVSVEMQFYLIFPWIAKLMRRLPMLTYSGMVAISYVYIWFRVMPMEHDAYVWHFNQLPAMLCVYANGMLGAILFVSVARALRQRERYSSIFFTAVSIGSILAVRFVLRIGPRSLEMVRWQLRMRFFLSIFFMLFAVSTAFAVRWYRFLFANRVMRFLSAISYNLYIWHQTVAVQLKKHKIPYWEGEELPNKTGNLPWMRQYTLYVVIASLAVATLLTYCLEKPLAACILHKRGPWQKRNFKRKEPKRLGDGTE